MKLKRTYIISALVLSLMVSRSAYAEEYAATTVPLWMDAVEVMPEEEIIEDMPEEEIIEDMPDEEIIEDMPDEEIIEDMPDEEIIEDMPDEEIIEDMPDEEIIEDMPDEEIIEDMPDEDSQYAASSPEENEVQLGSEDILSPDDDTTVADELDIPTPVGEQGRGDCLNLEHYYLENGYPDYLSFIFVYDKFLDENEDVILQVSAGLTDMSQENIDAILDIADDCCYITFSEWQYSYGERKAVYDEIKAMDSEDFHVRLTYDDRVSVNVIDATNLEKYRKLFSEKYGDIVSVDCIIAEDGVGADGGGSIITPGLGVTTTTVPEIGTTGIKTDAPAQDNTHTVLIVAISTALVLMIAGGAFLLFRSRMKISSDGTVAASVHLTKADIEKAVADSGETPPAEVMDRIMREIK